MDQRVSSIEAIEAMLEESEETYRTPDYTMESVGGTELREIGKDGMA